MKPVKVDPALLLMSAGHLDMHRADHIEAHLRANSDIEGASVCWIGASAVALHSKAAEWASQSVRITNELTRLRDAFQESARGYAERDRQSAAEISRVPLDLAAATPPDV